MKKYLAVFILMLFASISLCGCNNSSTFGVWWWDRNLGDSYLEFAKNNGINEIYYCDSSFSNRTSHFISCANQKNIKVFLLAGEFQWLYSRENLDSLISNYQTYQNTDPHKFAGIHLDIEPHQASEFSQNRTELILRLIEIVYQNHITYPNIHFAYDIPFWLDDEIVFNNQTKPAYAHIIDYADRVFLMSYRYTAEKIYDIAKDEINYAKSQNKTLVLGVETKSSEGDQVSFMEEGSLYMLEQLEKLKTMLPKNFGICIHQIKTWFNLG